MLVKKLRRLFIAGNWKMNATQQETRDFFSELSTLLQNTEAPSSNAVQACLFPPTLSLETALHAAKNSSFPIHIGSQNTHWETKGAFTGELSGPMLQEIGIKWTLVAHSERRQYFGETHATARLRTASLLKQGFQVILCIGETRQEREMGRTQAVLVEQLHAVLKGLNDGLDTSLTPQLILAYEPVWAIGTGLTATPAQAEEAHQMVRAQVAKDLGQKTADSISILYGGSVTLENMTELLACPNVDGALVGGASLKAKSYFALLRAGFQHMTPYKVTN